MRSSLEYFHHLKDKQIMLYFNSLYQDNFVIFGFRFGFSAHLNKSEKFKSFEITEKHA